MEGVGGGGGASLVPVGFGIAVKGREHDGEDLGSVVADQAHDILIIPVVQRSLCYLTTQFFTGLRAYTDKQNAHCTIN